MATNCIAENCKLGIEPSKKREFCAFHWFQIEPRHRQELKAGNVITRELVVAMLAESEKSCPK